MRMRVRPSKSLLVACALACLAAPAVQAQDNLGLQIHGFGGWYYGRANSVQFLGAVKGGSAENTQFALNVAATPIDRVTIVAQMNLRQDRSGSDTQLDYAFVNYDLASRVKIRAGRAKHPWGIYGEIFDVGTARPFQHLAQAIYGPVGFTAKAYNGIGLTGSMDGDSGWGLQWDLYGGEIDGDYEESGLFSFETQNLPQKYSFQFTNKEVVGTRLKLNTPVDGLWAGVSAYTGKEDSGGGTNLVRKSAYLGSLEYVGDRLLLRAESGYFEADKSYHGTGSYAELAYKLTQHWQIAGRWDDFNLHLTAFKAFGPVFPPYISERFDESHSEKILGLNYWLNSNVVVRVSFSRVSGQRLLFPTSAELQNYIDNGVKPDTHSNILIIGTQFSF